MTAVACTYQEAAHADPTQLKPGDLLGVRFGDRHAVIGPVPTGYGPTMLAGELRGGDHTQLFIAPATGRGMALLLQRLQTAYDTDQLSRRAEQIRDMRAAGATIAEIARHFHISTGHAHRLVKRAAT